MKWVVILMAASTMAGAGDLDAIRETQKKLVALRGKNPGTRDAVPELTVLKHQVRDWAESRVLNAGSLTDVGAFATALNAELHQQKLPLPDDDQEFLGDVAPFKISHPSGDSTWLQIEIGVGVQCEYDDSLYLYEWSNGIWNQRYLLEQDDYTEKNYLPRHYDHVAVSPSDPSGNRLILTVANTWGCASSWQFLLYRLSRIGSSDATLADGSSLFFMDDDPGRSVRLETDGTTIEFPGDSLDTTSLMRPHVLHFTVEGDQARRVEPVALTAQDFVDEWVTSKWDEIAAWTNPALRERHQKLARTEADWHFAIVQRCIEPADQWQIELDREDNKTGDVRTYYFLVEQNGLYGFRMADISEERQRGCPGNDPPMSAGDLRPTLFPKK